MTTVSDTDIKEIKEAIAALGKQIIDVEKNLTVKINDVEKSLTVKINDVEKSLTVKINDVEKNLTANIADLSGEVKATKAQIEQLDKRITNQEFIYRAVFISIITVATTAIGTSVIRFFWDNPLFRA